MKDNGLEHDALVWMLASLVKRSGGSVTFNSNDDVEGYVMYSVGNDIEKGIVVHVIPKSSIGNA